MPNVTVTPPSVIKVQVGPAVSPKATSIAYGAGRTLRSLTDVNTTDLVDGEVLVYKASSDSFIFEPVENTVLQIDNGFF